MGHKTGLDGGRVIVRVWVKVANEIVDKEIILLVEDYVRKVEGLVNQLSRSEQSKAKRKKQKRWQFWK